MFVVSVKHHMRTTVIKHLVVHEVKVIRQIYHITKYPNFARVAKLLRTWAPFYLMPFLTVFLLPSTALFLVDVRLVPCIASGRGTLTLIRRRF